MSSTNFEDFPECFYLEDWKVAFFNSEAIQEIVKKQISPKTLT
jgi:hypothetical protein